MKTSWRAELRYVVDASLERRYANRLLRGSIRYESAKIDELSYAFSLSYTSLTPWAATENFPGGEQNLVTVLLYIPTTAFIISLIHFCLFQGRSALVSCL